jgi:galactose mutarotase-like enzyme
MVSATRLPVRVATDPDHGGRWTSLTAGGREWLWHRDEPRRRVVRPGDPFADAGGLEECVPTVRGLPDHGDAWSRPWRRAGEEDVAECPDFRLTRRIGARGDAVVADYTLAAEPGYRFVWAAHALLDLSPAARIDVVGPAVTRLHPDEGDRWLAGNWPSVDGVPLDRLGPDDGSAVGAVVLTSRVSVHDGADALNLSVEADGQPVAVALWRNLGGFPQGAPYRSIGVEPMLGRVFDRAAADDGDTAVVPPAGEVTWRLTVTATRRT